MTYREQITPWVVLRQLPNMQRMTLARFRKRSDADSYSQTLRQLDPRLDLVVMFDPGDAELQPPIQNRPRIDNLESHFRLD